MFCSIYFHCCKIHISLQKVSLYLTDIFAPLFDISLLSYVYCKIQFWCFAVSISVPPFLKTTFNLSIFARVSGKSVDTLLQDRVTLLDTLEVASLLLNEFNDKTRNGHRSRSRVEFIKIKCQQKSKVVFLFTGFILPDHYISLSDLMETHLHSWTRYRQQNHFIFVFPLRFFNRKTNPWFVLFTDFNWCTLMADKCPRIWDLFMNPNGGHLLMINHVEFIIDERQKKWEEIMKGLYN